MELIELYDPSINKLLKVKVPSKIAEKCRKNSEFAQALFEEIQKENIQDGSVLDVAISDIDDDEECPTDETANNLDREYWSSEETLKLLEVLKKQRHLLKGINTMTKDDEMTIWQIVSSDLANVDINKDANKCKIEWNKILHTFSSVKNQPGNSFQYSKQVSDILNDSQVESGESDGDPTQPQSKIINASCFPLDRERWSQFETLKFMKVYQTLKRNWKTTYLDKRFWIAISKELNKYGIHKNYKKCENKWRNLLKAHKNSQKNNAPQKFFFYQEMNNILNDVNLEDSQEEVIMEEDERESSQIEEEVSQDCKRSKMSEDMEEDEGRFTYVYWSDKESAKLIEAYKKHKKTFALLNNRKVWELISQELAISGIQKEADRCRNKWRNLKRSYMNSQLSKNASKCYFTKEMQDALGDDLAMKVVKNGSANTKTDDSDDERFETLDGFSDRKSGENGLAKESDNEESDNLGWGEDGKKDQKDSWTRYQTTILIDAYREHRETKATDKTIDWTVISLKLSTKGICKPPDECRKKWSVLYKDYVANKFKLGEGTFAFQDEIDAIFTNITGGQVKVVHCDKCRCCEKKMAEKQKRHIERMNLLKTRLDVEKRKVLAFEKYLSTISS